MHALFERLRPFSRLIATHCFAVVLLGLIVSAAGGILASRLTIESDFSKLVPSNYPSVQALERLRDTVGGESEATVVVESPSFEANKAFAEELIPRVLALRQRDREPYFTHADFRKDTSFLQRNALYLATDEELDSLRSLLESQIEAARLEANPFYFDLEDEDSGLDVDNTRRELESAYTRLVGTEYPVSDDSTAMAVKFFPGGAQTNIAFIEDAYDALQSVVDDMSPSSYHPEMEVVLAGRLMRQLVEVQAITDDVRGSFGAGVTTVLLMVVIYLVYKSYHARTGRRFSARILLSEVSRAPVTAAVIGVPLLAALSWTFGTAYLVYGNLNLMTSTLGLVLFGLGIDYGIHFYGRYAEERGNGAAVTDAIESTFMTTGQAVTVTAFTTAAAFLLLLIADFKGFSEFGFIAGTGILFALIAMTILLPAIVALFERLRLLNLAGVPHRNSGAQRGRFHRFPAVRPILIVSVVGVGLSIWVLPSVSFEYDFGKLEPVYEDYRELQSHVRKVYADNGRKNPAYVIVDTPDEAIAVEAAVLKHAAEDSASPTIGHVETLQSRFPISKAAARAKLDRIADIRSLIEDPFLQADSSAWIARLEMAASTREPIGIEDIPEVVAAPFTAKDGSVGRLVLIYPSVGLSDGLQSLAFAEDVGTIRTEDGRTYHAGSTSLVAADMLRLMRMDAPLMVIMTLVAIIALKMAVLRSLRYTALALVPLVAGFTGMFGLMALFGIKLNFYNLVVLPAVLGIGDDAGVHIVHRHQEEGRGSILRVLSSTGEAITMSALTTIVGFGGLLLSFSPGLRSIGILATIGLTTTLVSALVLLPALLQWLEDRGSEGSGSSISRLSDGHRRAACAADIRPAR